MYKNQGNFVKSIAYSFYGIYDKRRTDYIFIKWMSKNIILP